MVNKKLFYRILILLAALIFIVNGRTQEFPPSISVGESNPISDPSAISDLRWDPLPEPSPDRPDIGIGGACVFVEYPPECETVNHSV